MSIREEVRSCPTHGPVKATVEYEEFEELDLRHPINITCPLCTEEFKALSYPDIEDTTRTNSFPLPRRFYLDRVEDMTEVQGTGVVALGVRFPDGRVALQWTPPRGKAYGSHDATQGERDDMDREVRAASMVMWDSTEAMMAVHGHHNLTALRWID